MRRIVKCKTCKGFGKVQVSSRLLGVVIRKETIYCGECGGTGRVEHLQKHCLKCGQFCGNAGRHTHRNVIEI